MLMSNGKIKINELERHGMGEFFGIVGWNGKISERGNRNGNRTGRLRNGTGTERNGFGTGTETERGRFWNGNEMLKTEIFQYNLVKNPKFSRARYRAPSK